jgi:hypothetical protein
MTVWAADNKTVGGEILLQLLEKPLVGRKTPNEEHGLHEKKLVGDKREEKKADRNLRFR